jgi:phospholipid-binding lipoprotein MlaA
MQAGLFGRVFDGALILAWLVTIGGCASTPDAFREPSDPLEPYNRAMFKFNTDFDNAFLKPIAKGYKYIAPEPVDRGVTNFFNNIDDLTSAVNNLLQFKLSRFGTDIGRVTVNSTAGLLGVLDVATNLGLPSYKEDFGQTLGYWGLGPGPYFVIPILGPSTIRDAVGLAGDIYVDPFISVRKNEIYWGAVGLRLIDRRADLLQAGDILEEAAVDPYSFLRDAYLQRRRTKVYDGNPPPETAADEAWYGPGYGSDPTPKAQ